MGTITTSQVVQLQTICRGKFRDREERLEALSEMAGTELSSVNDLSSLQAAEIIHFFNTGKPIDHSAWGFFNLKNKQHLNVLSICHSLGWVQEEKPDYVDLHKLGGWLKSDRSPVKKPLKEMETKEVSKVIFALQNILKTTFKIS